MRAFPDIASTPEGRALCMWAADVGEAILGRRTRVAEEPVPESPPARGEPVEHEHGTTRTLVVEAP